MQLEAQIHDLTNSLKKGELQVSDIGELVPASVMLHNLDGLQPTGCSYMNNWGCERLGTSVNDINELGESYYERYFIKEESLSIFQGMTRYLVENDFSKQYTFFQRVKLFEEIDYIWFFTVCKLVKIKEQQQLTNKLVLLSSPITGIGNMIQRFNKMLNQDRYVHQHYIKFAKLTKREKEIITLLCEGKSSAEIAEMLFVSTNTIITHRKNITKKLGIKSFAELIKFAIAFDLAE